MKILLTAVWLSLVLALPVQAHETVPASTDQAARAVVAGVFLPRAAHYELKTAAGRADWYLVRSENEIRSYHAGDQRAELWRRSADGAIESTRVFMQERRLIEYSAGELRTQRRVPQWAQLATIVAPEMLSEARHRGQRKVLGRVAHVYEGRLDGQPVKLWWLEQDRLPARLERGRGKAATLLSLRALHERVPAQWPLPDEAATAGFQRIDAADLGDLEYDPFVQKLLAQDPHHPAHGHAH